MGQLLMDAPQPMRDLIREVRRQVNELLTAERWVVMVAGRGVTEQTRLTDVEIAELWFGADRGRLSGVVQLVRDRPHADGSFDIDPAMGAPRPAFWGDVRSDGQRRPP
ncbi:MAG: hypothetical protein JWR70_3081 [Modestobacter sp.]|nr:hypothetical protein [Modestobacter sp.]